MTNVQGPAEALTVAGSRLRQWIGWVPQSGDVGMGVAINSYAGHVQFGLVTDAALTPDPEALVGRFPEEFETYLYYALLHAPWAAEAKEPLRSTKPSQPESAALALGAVVARQHPTRPARRSPPPRRGRRGRDNAAAAAARKQPSRHSQRAAPRLSRRQRGS